jgi:hypothetical protein
MASDSFFAITCMSMLALFYGSILAFAGYRFFLFLLPVLGFIWGFMIGAQSMQAIFNEGFLTSVVSWVVGFFFGLLFAVLSYLFYIAAVAILAGSLGYTIGVGFMGLIGIDFGFFAWMVGVIMAILVALAVIMLNIQKLVIIIATSLLGAGVIIGTFLFLFGKVPTSELVANPVRVALSNSFLWSVLFIAIAAIGFMAQYQSSKNFVIDEYNRMDDYYPTSAVEPVPGAPTIPVPAQPTTTPDQP